MSYNSPYMCFKMKQFNFFLGYTHWCNILNLAPPLTYTTKQTYFYKTHKANSTGLSISPNKINIQNFILSFRIHLNQYIYRLIKEICMHRVIIVANFRSQQLLFVTNRSSQFIYVLYISVDAVFVCFDRSAERIGDIQIFLP